MAATMSRPEALSLLLLLLLSLFFTFPSPAASLCVPRNSSGRSNNPPAAPTPAGNDKASPYPKLPGDIPPIADLPSIADAVDALCSHTDYKELCISSTRSFLPSTGTVTSESLLRLQMKAVKAGTEQLKSKVNAQAAAPGADSMTSQTLQVCAEQYDDACGYLDDAEKALARRDKGTLDTVLSALLDTFATCEDGFAEAALESPVSAEDLELQHLSSNCLALAELALK